MQDNTEDAGKLMSQHQASTTQDTISSAPNAINNISNYIYSIKTHTY